MFYQSILILLSISVLNYVNCQTKASATLETTTINGTVYFEEAVNGVRVTGVIYGLPVGLYGFHVHEIGDISTCDAAGAHFNPEGINHGGRDQAVRHVGDLGNVQFSTQSDGSIAASFDFVDRMIALNGTNNIVGRTLVLHEQQDDLGLGGHETSLTTGNAGARVACAIIRQTNSAGAVAPSLIMFTLSVVLLSISQ